jgi:hypothetical protein
MCSSGRLDGLCRNAIIPVRKGTCSLARIVNHAERSVDPGLVELGAVPGFRHPAIVGSALATPPRAPRLHKSSSSSRRTEAHSTPVVLGVVARSRSSYTFHRLQAAGLETPSLVG